ncbi:MAG: TonB-dependent receptor [Candidatus Latescibacteria bacterium]|nr:TonB-dependent receptor [Candidatus Latescibacterota bacterium]
MNSCGIESTIFNKDDIDALQASNISELLQEIAAIGIVERGAPGSQADITIRGSSIEGVLVMVNGISIRDPQTGHFTMDIPVDLSDVERVEVLHGGGAPVYGSTASGGVVNIITGCDTNRANGSFSIGSYGSHNTSAGTVIPIAGSAMSLDLHHGSSDGYTSGTDNEISGANVTGSYQTGALTVDWNMGLLQKKFGAEGFYGDYPSYEETLTLAGGLHAQHVLSPDSIIRIKAGARGHDDDFILVRDDPDLYRNTHYNRSVLYSGEFIHSINNNYFAVIGAESEFTGITSGALGNHSDRNNALYSGFTAEKGRANLSVSLRYDSGFRNIDSFVYGTGLMYALSARNHVKIRTEKSFRVPTYTELYYDSPANRGNPFLKPEYTKSVETGYEFTGDNISSGFTVFIRKAYNTIDWIRRYNETIWEAENHGEIITTGIEFKTGFIVTGSLNIRMSAMLLDQDVKRQEGIESKYTLNPAAKIVSGTITGKLPYSLKYMINCRFEEKIEGDTRAPLKISCSKKVSNYTISGQIRNVCNEQYEEIPGLKAPGRWFSLRLEYSR